MYGFGCIIVAIFFAYVYYCAWPLYKVGKEIEAILDKLAIYSIDEYDSKFNDIDEVLKNTNYIANPWKDFSKSLVKKEERSNGLIKIRQFSTSATSDYFNLNVITHNIDLQFWQNAGAYFTALGILGTFLGLVLGLSSLDVTSPDVSVLKNGIAGLLNGIEYSFNTSIVGVVAAIIYGWLHKGIVSLVSRKINALIDQLEKMYPRKTIEQLLMDNYQEGMKQTAQLRTLSTDMSERLGELFDNKLDKNLNGLVEKLDANLKPIFEKMLAALETLNAGGADAIAGAIDTHSGAALDGFANTLIDLRKSIEENIITSQNVVNTTNDKLMNAVEVMTTSFTSNAEKAAQRQETSMNSSAEKLQKMFVELQTSLEKTIADISNASEQANERIRNTIEDTNNTANSIAATFNLLANNQKNILEESAKGMIAYMQRTSDNTVSVLENHKTSMEKTYAQFQTMSDMTTKLLKEAAESVDKFSMAAKPVKSATEALEEQLELTMNANESVNNSINSNIQMLISSAHTTENSIRQLRSGLTDSEEITKAAWNRYKEDVAGVSGDLEKSIKIITDSLNKYNKQMDEEISDKLNKFDANFKSAISSLATAVQELQETVDALESKQ